MDIIKAIHREFKPHIDISYRDGAISFFKEPVKAYGVRTGTVRKIASRYWKDIKHLDKEDIFGLCEQLLKTDYMEDSTVAFSWAYRLQRQYDKSDFNAFERWLRLYVNNWAKCDDFCTHPFGALLLKYPEFLPKLNTWAKSKNRWMRRASAVILIHLILRADFRKKCFEIADILLLDDDDLVQKGYGWMLKCTAENYQKDVFDYVMKNKKVMPRTSLRYAIEKFPQTSRKKAMERG